MKKVILSSLGLMLLLNLISAAAHFRAGQSVMLADWAKHTIGTSASSSHPATATLASEHAAIILPSDTSVSQAATQLSAAGLDPAYASLYLGVQAQTGTPWQLLAAVHETETHQSGNTSRTSPAGATGPMQFLPATFRTYALDGDGDGHAVITNVNDAVLTAGRYLAAGGAARGDYRTALYHYNHSWSYVSHVLGIASRLGL
ncbi:MAG TPA: lytic transglycosylase domain-containing protein [Candidatus Saccharimonas sp.]|nr:lytic transglycosylase domain-containing protein [Candidatus Saccharimonas sp.]